jgi:hypothetical protein
MGRRSLAFLAANWQRCEKRQGPGRRAPRGDSRAHIGRRPTLSASRVRGVTGTRLGSNRGSGASETTEPRVSRGFVYTATGIRTPTGASATSRKNRRLRSPCGRAPPPTYSSSRSGWKSSTCSSAAASTPPASSVAASADRVEGPRRARSDGRVRATGRSHRPCRRRLLPFSRPESADRLCGDACSAGGEAHSLSVRGPRCQARPGSLEPGFGWSVGALRGVSGVRAGAQPYLGPRPDLASGRRHDG